MSDQTIHPCSVSGRPSTDYYVCGRCNKQCAIEERKSVGGAFSCDNCERLADAAPDLLAACEKSVELLSAICEVICVGNPPPHSVETLSTSRAAIAKAKGEEA